MAILLRSLLVTFLLARTIQVSAIDLPEIINDRVYFDNIKTVQLYREGNKLSNPVLTLNSGARLQLSFDDLSSNVKNYYYTIYHCDRNWRISSISQQEYMNSFTEFTLSDYEYSYNTKVAYINYMLNLPNEDVPLVYSGNYALVVFDYDEPEQAILVKRFYVVEPQVKISAVIHRATFDHSTGENQEVDFNVNFQNYPVQNPRNDIHVVVKQNTRTDNEITDLKPMYINNGILEYDYNKENNFKGENEFRYFEIRGIKYPGEGVVDVSFHAPYYHTTLQTDAIRVQKNYSFYKEMNGRYFIEAYETQYPDTESDYIFVHFTLPMENILIGGGVYVFGALSNWQCTPANEMKWNMERHEYELTILLKQGYYNYIYAWRDSEDEIIKTYALEGSHYETENDYQIFVYHSRLSDRYDKLVGYERFNSHLNKGF